MSFISQADGANPPDSSAAYSTPEAVLESISAEINDAAIFPLSTKEVFFFAFDLLLDQATISRHVRGMIPERIVRVPGHVLDWSYYYPPAGSALPTLTRTNRPEDSVWGILYNAKEKDFTLLERQLRVPNRYHRRQFTTLDRGDRRFPAFTYVLSLRDDEPSRPSKGYIEQLLSAARERSLPEDYIAYLEQLQTGE